MEQWGIYIAYAWLATIIWAFADAVQAIRKGPQPQAHPSGAIRPQLMRGSQPSRSVVSD